MIALLILGGVGMAAANNSANDRGDETATAPLRGDGDPGAPVQYTSATGAPKAQPAIGPASVAKAVSRVLNGMKDAPSLADMTVVPGPSGARVAVALTTNHDGVLDVWIADLAVGALAEDIRTNEDTISQVIASATATGPDANGMVTTSGLGSGPVSLGQVFASPTDSELSDRVRDVARRFGLSVSSLTILHPHDSALKVSLTVPTDTSVNWTIDQLRTALVGSSPDVEGVFVELDSPDGTPLLRSGVAYRTGEGGLWCADGQEGRFGALHGGIALQ